MSIRTRPRSLLVALAPALALACSDGGSGQTPRAGQTNPTSSNGSKEPHSGHTDSTSATESEEEEEGEFEPPPLQAGYQRLEPPPVEVPARSSDDWAQWVGGPLDQDYDVVEIVGEQSKGGHHALLYATPEKNPEGFTRLWVDEDQLRTRLMGGIGGEGGASAKLPPGVVFRVKKGSYLVAQTHFLNGTDEDLIGHTVLDMKLAPVDPSHRVASLMSSTTLAVELPARSSYELDVNCPVMKDLHFIQVANHMHDYGKTALTEFIDPSGERHEIKRDERWLGVWALSPNFDKFSPDDPLIVPAGSMLHTHCTWENTTDDPIAFPAEMCVFFGFIMNEADIFCTDEKWPVETDARDEDAGTSEQEEPSSDNPSHDDGGMGSAVPDAGDGGACENGTDQEIMEGSAFNQQSTDCSIPCALDPDIATCTARCFQRQVGLSAACAACNGQNIACSSEHCFSPCLRDSAGKSCLDCAEENCSASFTACTGLEYMRPDD